MYFVKSKTARAHSPATVTPLHRALGERISRWVHEEGLSDGARLNENRLAERLGVSRTPVRGALEHLARQGFVRRLPNRGVELVQRPPLPAGSPDSEQPEDDLIGRITHDRQRGRLADSVSEKDLMERYGAPRPMLKRVLDRMADLGIVERRLGYGWSFAADAWDEQARAESYRFRMLLEPAALLEPGFALPTAWIVDMRQRHRAFLERGWTRASSIAFFEMNASFHEGLAAASGNRYLLAAMQRQNRLRRLSNYDWKHGRARVEVNCREHLEMLDRLEAGDREMAALLMRRHLDVASQLRSSTAVA